MFTAKHVENLLKVSASGRFVFFSNIHIKLEAHKRGVEKAKQHKPIDQQFRLHDEKKNAARCVTEAEVLFC